VVVVAKLDRLFRSVADAANVIAEFDKKGIELIAIAEGFDMTTPYGRAMAQMASVFAELERAMIRERTRSAMSVKRSRGERISGYARSAGTSAPAVVWWRTPASRGTSLRCGDCGRTASPTAG
jgi:DNA invertase Pin-like site-specific DNA recombinase